MNTTEIALLSVFRAALHGEAPKDPELTEGEWRNLLRLSELHKILPLILDAVYSLPSCRAALRQSLPPGGKVSRPEAVTDEGAERQAAVSTNGSKCGEPPHTSSGFRETPESTFPSRGRLNGEYPDWKTAALAQVSRQAIQENEFLNLILALRERGLEPLVVKGAICRALYPKPLLRPSVDDDLLIPEDEGPAYHAAMLELGLVADDPKADPEIAWELSYHKYGSPLYLELHKCLFDPEDPVFRGFNELFDPARSRTVPVKLQDVTLQTLSPEDHLLFLLLHAFKHFLFSGFGLRIVADICLFTQAYAERIDASRLLSVCGSLRCDRFAAAVYRIGEKYLGLPAPRAFAELSVDETALLADVLDAGLHGAEIDRLHSANITLNAVKSQKEGTKASGSLRNTVFLPADKLSGRYPYLKKCPWLLPAAWVARVFGYLTDRKYGKQDPKTSIRIGRDRVRLLAEYGVIDS